MGAGEEGDSEEGPVLEEKLMEFTKDTFLQLQDAWSNKDREIMQGMLTPSIWTDWKKMMDAMDKFHQRNLIKDVLIHEILLVDIRDYTDDEEDRFTAKITASAVDYSIDEVSGKWASPRWKNNVDPNITMQRSTFTEFWTFQWKGKGCKLIQIDQDGFGSRYSGVANVLKDEKYMKEEKSGVEEETLADKWIKADDGNEMDD